MIEAMPNSRNTIPGTAFFSADLRHPDPAALDELVAGLKQSCVRIAEAGGLAYEMTEVTHYPATKFDEACVSAVRTAAERLGYSHRDIVSRAGRTIIVENNYSGQFFRYLRSETGLAIDGHIRKYDGEPFMPHHIVDGVVELLDSEAAIHVPYQEIIV